MEVEPRPVRALPNVPTLETEQGARTALLSRLAIVVTVVLGQLFALTVALEESLLDRDAEAWMLAGFSIVSFAVVLVLTRVDPAPRARRRQGHGTPLMPTYVSRPIEEKPDS
ncbi:MAG: hypothetical protein JJE52_02320 [Acidimicrobiia bacterium]|nr:hypothetical protein [Acidimicrobiia bacterium]